MPDFQLEWLIRARAELAGLKDWTQAVNLASTSTVNYTEIARQSAEAVQFMDQTERAFVVTSQQEYEVLQKTLEAAQRKLSVQQALGVETSKTEKQIAVLDAALSTEQAIAIADAAAIRQLNAAYAEMAAAQVKASVTTVSAKDASKILNEQGFGPMRGEAMALRAALAPLAAETFPGFSRILSTTLFYGINPMIIGLVAAAESVHLLQEEIKAINQVAESMQHDMDGMVKGFEAQREVIVRSRIESERFAESLRHIYARNLDAAESMSRLNDTYKEHITLSEKVSASRERAQKEAIAVLEKDPVKRTLETLDVEQRAADQKKRDEDELTKKKIGTATFGVQIAEVEARNTKTAVEQQRIRTKEAEKNLSDFETMKRQLDDANKIIADIQDRRETIMSRRRWTLGVSGIFEGGEDDALALKQRSAMNRAELAQAWFKEHPHVSEDMVKERAASERSKLSELESDASKAAETFKKLHDELSITISRLKEERAAREQEFKYDTLTRVLKAYGDLEKMGHAGPEQQVAMQQLLGVSKGIETGTLDVTSTFDRIGNSMKTYHDTVLNSIDTLVQRIDYLSRQTQQVQKQIQSQSAQNRF